MDFIITFFRDTLDGTLYIIVSIIAGILICSCIGYLAERSITKKKAQKQYEQEHFNVSTSSTEENNIVVSEVSENIVEPTSDIPMTTVTIDNPSNIDALPQSIPEMSEIPDMEASGENTSVNSVQNIGK